jgi:hypothetical protein
LNAGASVDADIFLATPYRCRSFSNRRSPLSQVRHLAFSTWSSAKLAQYLAFAGIAVVSRESIRQILRDGGVCWQATKTWKLSTDPDFVPKMHRVPDLTTMHLARSGPSVLMNSGR